MDDNCEGRIGDRSPIDIVRQKKKSSDLIFFSTKDTELFQSSPSLVFRSQKKKAVQGCARHVS